MKLNGLFSLWGPLVLVFLLRLPDFFVPYYNNDELTNSLFANMILDGRMTLLDFLGNTYLLTHYFYAACTALFGRFDLFPIYVVNLLWCLATAGVFYTAGRELTGRREGGFWAAVFYAIASVSFMSKDYRAVLSESLSLLPLAGAAFFYFRAVRLGKNVFYLTAGLCIGLAGLFKAPSAIMILALWSSLLFIPSGPRLLPFLGSGLGLAVAVFSQLLFVGSPVEGFNYMAEHVEKVRKYYIGAYENLPVFYWVFKYLLRTCLVAVSCPLVWFCAFRTLRHELAFRGRDPDLFRKKLIVLFLFFWFLTSWFAVTIGKRVFYHYFIFTIPPIVLLAVPTILEWTDRLKKRSLAVQRPWRVLLALVLLIPPTGYAIEAVIGLSPQRPHLDKVVEEVTATTRPGDRIFVWGSLPQIYFFSRRDPATTFFWSDTLAGMSPGTPAMEYMRATGKRISLPDAAVRDLVAWSFVEPREAHPVNPESLRGISENELLSVPEVLEKIENPFWKKAFADFFASPPVLILDASPTGLRGFSSFPLEKYELLKKFVEDNYLYEKTVDGIIFYRLK
ncbi:MAG: glycosyltransferase family 39 protein [Deltaproteobacteria bacterium]|nr:glycosyltransferase family 39 protein [Deltaproteobacteria bacterium]